MSYSKSCNQYCTPSLVGAEWFSFDNWHSNSSSPEFLQGRVGLGETFVTTRKLSLENSQHLVPPLVSRQKNLKRKQHARTKQNEQTHRNRAIWLVYQLDTNLGGFRLARVKKLHAQKLSSTNWYFALTSYCNTIRFNAFSIDRFFLQKNEESMFWSFHSLAGKTK